MLKLEIVTPEKLVLATEADSVTVPTASGEAGILPNHAPLISALKPGILSFTNRAATQKIAIGAGFVEVSGDTVAVLTDDAAMPDEIDANAARADRESAEKALAALVNQPAEEWEALSEKLDSANARLQLAAGK